MRLTLLDLLEATGGGEVGGTQVGERYSTYHTDSREVQPGGVFFALRGAEMDGHKFVKDAIARGAAAVVVERRLEAPSGIVEIVVPDTWKALYDVAALVLSRVKPLVVGVTGSNGKTSTKEMTAAVLSTKFETLRNTGNLNTETGVPLTILQLEPNHKALVLEMGLQRAGDIARLVALARPSIGVITNTGAVHMEFFATQEDLARAKGELVAGLPATGHAVLNAVSGRHQALNAAAALAAGEAAGVPLNEGAPALAGVSVEHRLQEFTTPAGFIVVDDAYNASPESMLAAFATMQERPHDGRLLAVLGHMGELGDSAGDAHRHVGEVAASTFDRIAVVDTALGRMLAEAARADVVPDNAAAIAWVREHAREGDRVLVKGSHSRHLEEVVAGLISA
ncbi:MAG: UDP-N-acetylmuramoyl-tripeptide--D-alanyl-D-alanine ligase [Chloroflexi bacterium]|nr:MAG: UDP-N-acetylmuramoyl-tripeptide--D-alanyl-D-alanine ligase [Chloroflexota bacterium]